MARLPKLEKVEENLKIVQGVATITIDQQMLRVLENAPKQVIGHTRLVLAGLKSSGAIEEFEVHGEELAGVWELLIKQPLVHPISIVVGYGGKKVSGIQVDINPEEKEKGFVTINLVPAEVQRHHPLWLEHYINSRLKLKGAEWEVDPASIQSMWERVVHSKEVVENFEIAPKSDYNPRRQGKAYNVKIRSGFVIECFKLL